MILYVATQLREYKKGLIRMRHLFLALLIVFDVKAFGKEDSAGYFDDETHVSSVVRTYCPLAPDAIDKIYDTKKDSHRIAIVKKEDMPVCLQPLPGPFPFHGHSGDVRLGSLKTDYFAALQFDKPEVQRETAVMREDAGKIRSRNPVEALQLCIMRDGKWVIQNLLECFLI
jgi:hypothetical protein